MYPTCRFFSISKNNPDYNEMQMWNIFLYNIYIYNKNKNICIIYNIYYMYSKNAHICGTSSLKATCLKKPKMLRTALAAAQPRPNWWKRKASLDQSQKARNLSYLVHPSTCPSNTQLQRRDAHLATRTAEARLAIAWLQAGHGVQMTPLWFFFVTSVVQKTNHETNGLYSLALRDPSLYH